MSVGRSTSRVNVERVVADETDPAEAWTTVYCHRPYNPYNSGLFRKVTDGRLLDFKMNENDGLAKGVADFAELLSKLELPRGTLLVVVPGHEARPSNAGRQLALAAQQLAA